MTASTPADNHEDTPPPLPGPSARRSVTARPRWQLWLLVLLAVALAGYGWLQMERNTRRLDTAMARQTQHLEESQQQLRELQAALGEQRAQQRRDQLTTQDALQLLQGQQQQQQQQLQALRTTDRSDWLLAEAEYLLRLANQRVLMGRDARGAQQMLKSADEILLKLDDPALHPVRAALADSLAALQQVAQIDTEGSYLRLTALAKQAAALRLLEAPAFVPDEAPPERLDSGSWRDRLQAGLAQAWEKLSHYIQITRRDEVYRPLLAPPFEAALRQNVQLMFEQAQVALLAGNQTLYESSLDRAAHWLKTFYTLDPLATEKVLEALAALRGQAISVVLPDISESLRSLQRYQDTLHLRQRAEPAPAAAEGGA